MTRTLFVAPAGRNVGLTTASLGLVRALDRQGVRVTFAKPISTRAEDRSTALIKLGTCLLPPPPLPRKLVEDLLSTGDEQTLLEKVVEFCDHVAEGADVLVVEGMVSELGAAYAMRVNNLVLKALDAELVLVGAPFNQTATELADALSIAARGFGDLGEGRQISCILNRVPAESEEWLATWSAAITAEKMIPVAIVPARDDLSALRVKDLAEAIHARVLFPGDMAKRRYRDVKLYAMTVANSARYFAPDRLLITPADRDDIILAVSLAVMGGMRMAGLVLTGGIEPDERIMQLCAPAFATGLPVLHVDTGSYETANMVASIDKQIPIDDKERVELAMNVVADRIDASWLRNLVAMRRSQRLSPPAFRHHLVEDARKANKRIVLPEGTEPRTLKAVQICHERKIARCVLLGNPQEIRDAALKAGVTLPDDVEIIDHLAEMPRLAPILMELRKAKGMTRDQAEQELSDTIMPGTLLLKLGEVDGLVSGAVHTTAHTIRPALQLIKTAPGCSLVSSIFFICLPEQVVVFGDCAVNPNPTSEQLADIAIQSAESAIAFGIPARVAMLSYSTGESGTGADVELVKQASAMAKAKRPDLAIDGPLQYDAATQMDVARSKAPKSAVAGKATVLIFPDLNTGNVTYKAVQRSANVVSIGPMLQGMAKPVNDLSRGALVDDIVFTIALTAIQAAAVKPAARAAT